MTVDEFGLLAHPDADGLFPIGDRHGGGSARQRFPAESARRRYTLKIGNREMTAAHMYELLSLGDDVETLGRWSNRFLSGRPVFTSRQVGRGAVLYLGTYLSEALVDALVSGAIAQAGVEPLLADLPLGVEVCVRENDSRHLLFVLNTLHEEVAIQRVPKGTMLVCDGILADTTLTLPGYGCAIVRLSG